MRIAPASLAMLGLISTACGGGGGAADAPPGCEPVEGRPPLGLIEVATGLDMPVYVTSPPGDLRLFVLEKGGAVRIVAGDQVLPTPFLTVDVPSLGGLDDERGLLGLAFHPDYASNGRLFVFYIDAGSDEVIEEYAVDPGNPDLADPGSATEVFRLDDFAGNHNGGTLQFGPDGYLYVGIGDGGGGGDPMDYGQNVEVAFGKILRLDIDTSPVSAPADNPFSGVAGLDQIWSYGWRNPWRWSFDRQTGDMYIGDVGQGAWEEIDVEPRSSPGGLNYGWNEMEGAHCYDAVSCDEADKVLPVIEWDQNSGDCSAIGGYVYRGCALPGYHGTYFFADYCGGWVRSLEWDGAGGYTNLTSHDALGGNDIVSFGEDAAGELYVVRQDSGQIMKIVAP